MTRQMSLPAGADTHRTGEFECTPLVQPPFQGWTQVRLLFGNGNLALRVITALFDAGGCPQTVSDLIASENEQQQETLVDDPIPTLRH